MIDILIEQEPPVIEHFACCDADGTVLWVAHGPQGTADMQNPGDGKTIHLCNEKVTAGWLRSDEDFSVPDAVVLTIEERRTARRAQAQVCRVTKIEAGCMTPLGRVQTDQESQASILQAMFRANLALSTGETWSIDWLMEDNSVVAHDAEQMIAMGLAVGAWKTACFAASVPILEEIKVSDDPEGIDITVGYPDGT